MNEKLIATQVIESLRKGIPPQRGVSHYTIGHEKLIDGFKRFHLNQIEDSGRIRFISGSWGAGKTHVFRQLREVAFENNCLVSSVELNVGDAALNKFQSVFSAIIRNISTPTVFERGVTADAAPLGNVLRESLSFLALSRRDLEGEIPYEAYERARTSLLTDQRIDVDFKKMIQTYWETFLPEAPEPAIQELTRAETLQWFTGEGSIGAYRKRFGVNKIVTKDNARLLLQSLAGFVQLSGYRGLLILFDEAEQAYSSMRKSQLREAQNNLLSLINNIENLPGLFLLYATTPDFYTDPRHGIVQYGALAGRIGQPEEHSPKALDIVWNLDAITHTLTDYQSAAKKIRTIYLKAYPEVEPDLPTEPEIEQFVSALFKEHPALSSVRFWRVLVTALVSHFDDHIEGEVRPVLELYEDVMDRLREE